ncbi:MAG: hypothetical protein ACK44W_03725 [Planctomycetota bacterium]
MAHDTFQAGELTAVIGDNEAYGGRRSGYNGVHRLVHRRLPEVSLFGLAGLNFEHIFDGDQDLRDLETRERRIFFEPRHAPMEFRKLSETEAELYQPPTPTFFLESWTRFRLVPPHFVDFEFRCKPYQHAFRNGYIGLFWASYINAPENKSIYFRDGEGWVQLCTQAHNVMSTVRHRDDRVELKFLPGAPPTLYQSYSVLRFEEPLFYGHFRDLLFVLMFDRAEGIRLAHSPSSGGRPSFPNPAWDFQYILPRYEVLREYGFRARAAYRERCGRDEILAEYESWRRSLK